MAKDLSAEQIEARKAKFAQKKARRAAAKLARAPTLNTSAEHAVLGSSSELKQYCDVAESSPGKRGRDVEQGDSGENLVKKWKKQKKQKKQKKSPEREERPPGHH